MSNFSFKYLFIIVLLLFSSCKITQLAKQKTNVNPSLLAVDNLGNKYKIVGNRITKFSFNNDSITSFSELNYGNISSVDVKNAMQILVFYKEQQVIILLDNSLTELRKIFLSRDEDSWITLACVSNRDNSFWLYYPENQTLKKVDNSLETINITRNVGQLLSKNIEPIQLIEKNNSVYLLDKEHGVFVFDLYGNYYKTIPVAGAKRIKVYEKGILYQTENKLSFFHFLSFEKTVLLTLDNSLDDFELTKKGVLGITNNELRIIFKKFK